MNTVILANINFCQSGHSPEFGDLGEFGDFVEFCKIVTLVNLMIVYIQERKNHFFLSSSFHAILILFSILACA